MIPVSMANSPLVPLLPRDIFTCARLVLSSAEGPTTRATPSSNLHAGAAETQINESWQRSRTLAKSPRAAKVPKRHS